MAVNPQLDSKGVGDKHFQITRGSQQGCVKREELGFIMHSRHIPSVNIFVPSSSSTFLQAVLGFGTLVPALRHDTVSKNVKSASGSELRCTSRRSLWAGNVWTGGRVQVGGSEGGFWNCVCRCVCVGFSQAAVGAANNGGVDKGPSYTCSAWFYRAEARGRPSSPLGPLLSAAYQER